MTNGSQRYPLLFTGDDDGRILNSKNAVGEDTNGELNYGFVYDFASALKNDIVRPSSTPAVFELRNPNQDIYGRVL